METQDNEHKRRFDALMTDRSTIESTWQVIERFIMPYRGQFFEKNSGENSINWSSRDIYDSTAPMAAQSLSASMHSALCPAGSQWFTGVWRDPAHRKNRDMQDAIEEANQIALREIDRSNFNTEAGEWFMDAVGFGTDCMLTEPLTEKSEYRGLQFTTVPVKDFVFEPGFGGDIRGFYWRMNLTPSQILARFKLEDLPDATRDKMKNPAFTDKTEIVYYVRVREGMNPDETNTSKKLPVDKRPFVTGFFLRSTGERIGEEGGEYEMPAAIVRMMRTTDSVWGNSPSMLALPDVLTLNQLLKIMLEAVEKATDPPWATTERGLFGDLDLNAGALNVVRGIDEIKPMTSGARFDVSQMKVEDLRNSIRRYFHVDQLQLKEGPQMTATEVSVRYELMNRHLSPIVGHITEEGFDRIIKRVFGILMRYGKLPKLEKLLREGKLKDADIRIDYTGPLARAQRMDAVMSVERVVAFAANASQAAPETMDLIDVDTAVEIIADHLSTPTTLLRSDAEIKRIRDERKQQQEQARQAAMAQAQGKALESVGKGAKDMQAVQQGAV